MPAEQELQEIAERWLQPRIIAYESPFEDDRRALAQAYLDLKAELLAAQERETFAYAQILNALDPNRGGYSSQALDRLRRFARQASGLGDEQAAALAASPSEKP